VLIVAIVGCAARSEVATVVPAGSSPKPQSQAAAISAAATTPDPLLSRRCGGCHAVPQPAKMSGRAWLDGVKRMRRRIRLPESEWDSLAAMAVGDTMPSASKP
jgi:hypothetical protein